MPMPTTTRRSEDQTHGLAAAIALRAGLDWTKLPVGNVRDPDKRRQAQERAADKADAIRIRSLVDLCEQALRMEGGHVPDNIDDTIRFAVSTATLEHAFTDAIGAMVSDGYDNAPDTTDWCEEVDVRDFREQTDITLGASNRPQKHARGGTANHASISDNAEKFRIARYSQQLVVDEMDIIDDRFELIQELPREMAEAARQLRPDLVYALLLANPSLTSDSTAIFHAGHSNLGTAVLGAEGLQAGITAMGLQRLGERALNVRARNVIVPPDLSFTARQLINSSEVRGDAAANGTRNPLQGQGLNVVEESRISTGGVVDPDSGVSYAGSATNWFLASDRRTVAVAYLIGSNRRPVVRSTNLTGGRWGLGVDIKLDIAAYARDFRGLYKSTGAGA
ncbi:MAG: hypothetical protein AAGD32_06220 [Planctomycetota bacterium]